MRTIVCERLGIELPSIPAPMGGAVGTARASAVSNAVRRALVGHAVDSDADSRRAVDGGVDIVIAEEWEARGHVRGMVATMPLVPGVVDAVPPTPVVAAGGIADGRGLAAALALGAAGAWIGTPFFAIGGAAILLRYLELVLKGDGHDIVYLDNLFAV